jgi:hypothetical protein
MIATIGTITLDEVRGIITPLATPVVEDIDNPGLTPAAVLLPGAVRVDRLTYRGFETASIKATAFALVGTVVTAYDETGASASVLVRGIELAERPARCAGTLGVWVELRAETRTWA